MGETVDALVVGAYAHRFYFKQLTDYGSPTQLVTTDLGSVEEAYPLSYARSWMIETQLIRTMNRSKQSFHLL